MSNSTTRRVRSVLDGIVHQLPAGPTWLHNLADAGQRCPCRPDIRRGIVVHHRNVILEANGRALIRAAVARNENVATSLTSEGA